MTLSATPSTSTMATSVSSANDDGAFELFSSAFFVCVGGVAVAAAAVVSAEGDGGEKREAVGFSLFCEGSCHV